MDEKKSFTVAMRDFFGYRPDGMRDKDANGKELSGLADFSKELKALTPSDKLEFAAYLGSEAPAS